MSTSDHNAIERAVLAVLRPLIKVALQRGMAHGRFSDLAKEAYVDVSRDLAGKPGEEAERVSYLDSNGSDAARGGEAAQGRGSALKRLTSNAIQSCSPRFERLVRGC